jgi:hypothetical protein
MLENHLSRPGSVGHISPASRNRHNIRRNTMNGDDLARRMGHQRADGKALAKLRLLWRQRRDMPGATAADCAKHARDPLRRLEPLRRRVASLSAS